MNAKQLRAALAAAIACVPRDPGPLEKRNAVRDWRRQIITRAFENRPLLVTRESDLLINNILPGLALDPDAITPFVVPCHTEEDFLVFKYFSLWSSFPTTDRPGRRLKLLIRDAGNKAHPLMGICCLSSPMRQLQVRDAWIGWQGSEYRNIRARNLVYITDLSTCVCLPPYSFLTGGKLLAGLMTTDEIRSVYRARYHDQLTLRQAVTANELYLLTTSGCYSSNTPQYKGLKHAGRHLYKFLGYTRGYSHFQVDPALYDHVKALVRRRRPETAGQFRTWSNSKIRVLRMAARELDIPEEGLVFSGHKRAIFAAPLAENWRGLLIGDETEARSISRPASGIVESWKETWVRKRTRDRAVMLSVRSFRPQAVRISHLLEGLSEEITT